MGKLLLLQIGVSKIRWGLLLQNLEHLKDLIVHFLYSVLYDNYYNFISVNSLFIKIDDVLSYPHECRIQHLSTLVVHTYTNGNLHLLFWSLHLTEHIVPVNETDVLEIAVEVELWRDWGPEWFHCWEVVELVKINHRHYLFKIELSLRKTLYYLQPLCEATLFVMQCALKWPHVQHVIKMLHLYFRIYMVLELSLKLY